MKLPMNDRALSSESLDTLFREARTFNRFLDRPVSPGQLRSLYELAKFGPTAANSCPTRFVFLSTPEAKARILPFMSDGNRDKTALAPVVAILGRDLEFHEKLPFLFPHADAKSWFEGNDASIRHNALLNGGLQAGYFLLAARSLGLDCGPMGGFDSEKVDAEFFPGTQVKSFLVVNLGFGDRDSLHPRSPRLPFEEACRIL